MLSSQPSTAVSFGKEELQGSTFLEQRRIVGTCRERTVWIPHPAQCPSSRSSPEESPVFVDALQSLGMRVSVHVEESLSVQRLTLEKEMDDLESRVERTCEANEKIIRAMKKLKKIISRKTKACSEVRKSKQSTAALCSKGGRTSLITNNKSIW
jgi:hypothetical protein